MKNIKKKNKNKSKKPNKKSLIKHNTEGYIADLYHICKLGKIKDSTKDWIETTMLSLRERANKFERLFAEQLLKRKIAFMHQAPFIFSGKIYFADFYLPKTNTIVEIDGEYHNGFTQQEYDQYRDECFNGHRIKVVRIPNTAVLDEKILDVFCAGII